MTAELKELEAAATSDIVENLRERAKEFYIQASRDWDELEEVIPILRMFGKETSEAADTITRLRADLLEAVEALREYNSAVVVDVLMEGPRFMGTNRTAMERAWKRGLSVLSRLEKRS